MDQQTDVVIIGAGLTGLALGFNLKKAGIDFVIIEKENKTGGVISTATENGFVFEKGPNTGVLSTPELVKLFEDLGDACKLAIADRSAAKRYILKGGKWTALPSGPVSAISTPLFTLKDKFRILGEPFRKPGTDPDETVAHLVKRRLGESFLDYAVNPFISGVYAGDPEKLITRYALPKLYALEQKYGSFIKGTIAKSKQKKTDLEKKATREVFSVEGGLGNLVKALTGKIGKDRIITCASKTTVARNSSGYSVTFESAGRSSRINSSRVVTTTGGHNLQTILPFINSSMIRKITTLEYARVLQVSAGYKRWDGMKLDAFGGLVPAKEKRRILGILFPSAIFRDRAPAEGALLSVFLGGIRNPDIYEKDDPEITAIVLREISETMFSDKKPDLFRISRYAHAIPQYGIDSGERFECIREIEEANPGLVLAGNIRDGIGMADRVKQAARIADQLSK